MAACTSMEAMQSTGFSLFDKVVDFPKSGQKLQVKAHKSSKFVFAILWLAFHH